MIIWREEEYEFSSKVLMGDKRLVTAELDKQLLEKPICENQSFKVVLCPTTEGYGHAQRICAIASRLKMSNIDFLVFSDEERIKFLSQPDLKCNNKLHGIKYVYSNNGDLNVFPTVLRLIFGSLYFPIDFLRILIMSLKYRVLINDYNPHLTCIPGMRTINITHYLPFKYGWREFRMNFYSYLVERPIVWGERVRSFLGLSENFAMDIRPEVVDCEKVYPPIVRDVTKTKSKVREELGLGKNEPLVLVMGRPYQKSCLRKNYDFHIYKKIALEHPDIHFHVVAPSGICRELEQENLKFNGFLPDIQNYINASSLVITRGGFGTISEAIMYGVPLLLFSAKEHMEKRKNALMVQKYGYGKIAENLEKDVLNLLDEPPYKRNELQKMGNGLDYFLNILTQNEF